MNFLIESGFVWDAKSGCYVKNHLVIPKDMYAVINESMKPGILFLAENNFNFTKEPETCETNESMIVSNGIATYKFFEIINDDTIMFPEFEGKYKVMRKELEN